MKHSWAKISIIALLASLLGSCAILGIGNQATTAVLSEPDPALAKDALPAFIKVSESLMLTYPDKPSFKTATASLYLLYATGFLDGEAWYMEDTDYDEWLALKSRAMGLYRRAFALTGPLIEKKSPGFFSGTWAIASAEAQKAAAPFRTDDIPAMYYCAASILAAFSSNPLDFEMSSRLPAALTLLNRALELDRQWGQGSLLELAFQVFAAMPDSLGISSDDADAAYRDALLATEGLSASLFVNYALQRCVPQGNRDEFLAQLQKAMNISDAEAPNRVLMNAMARRKAAYLAQRVDDYFYEGGDE